MCSNQQSISNVGLTFNGSSQLSECHDFCLGRKKLLNRINACRTKVNRGCQCSIHQHFRRVVHYHKFMLFCIVLTYFALLPGFACDPAVNRTFINRTPPVSPIYTLFTINIYHCYRQLPIAKNIERHNFLYSNSSNNHRYPHSFNLTSNILNIN